MNNCENCKWYEKTLNVSPCMKCTQNAGFHNHFKQKLLTCKDWLHGRGWLTKTDYYIEELEELWNKAQDNKE